MPPLNQPDNYVEQTQQFLKMGYAFGVTSLIVPSDLALINAYYGTFLAAGGGGNVHIGVDAAGAASIPALVFESKKNETARMTPNGAWLFGRSTPIGSDAAGNVEVAGTLTVGALAGVTIPTGANPSASAGLTAVNGSAATFLRSDGAPAISQAIIPTWTGKHIFTGSMASNGASDLVQLAVKAYSSQTANLQEWQNSGGSALTYITPLGLAFFRPANYDIVSGGNHGIVDVLAYSVPSNNMSGQVVGMNFDVRIPAGSTFVNTIVGIAGSARLYATSTNNYIDGAQFQVQNTAGGTIVEARGLYVRCINSGAGAITDNEGIVIDTPSNGGTITRNYGLRILDQNVGTTKYSIYTGLGAVHFGDSVDLASGKGITLIAANIATDTTTGTKIGTAGGSSGQKLGFFNATPIVQPLLATGASKVVDDVITVLQNLGLVRQT